MTPYLRAPRHCHSRILGLGTYRPRRVVGNAEVCRSIDSSPEWIETRSGIRTRRFAAEDETLLAMAVAAGGKALSQAGIVPAQLGCVVVASMSNLVQTPPLAIAVARELGAVRAGGFDLSAACAGFCHALAVSNDLVCTGQARYVLVIGVERMTDIVDPADRSIAFMFADGAGAVVVGESPDARIGPAVRGADGACIDALRMTGSWAAPGLPRPTMKMDGKRVFRWALAEVVPAAREALSAAGITAAELAAFVPHQANLRMIEVLADRLGLPCRVRVAADVTVSGNTSAASIPLAMERLLSAEPALAGEPALLIAFGAGLNYAGQVVLLP